METTVRDNPEESRYEIRDGDHVLGLAAYERRGDTTVFTHTEVDPDAGQNGLGSTLVRAALDDVRGQRRARWCRSARSSAAGSSGTRTTPTSWSPAADDRPGRRRPRPGRSGRAGHPARVRRLRVPVLRGRGARAAAGGGGVRRAGAAGVPQLPARRRAPLRADRGAGRRGGRRPGRVLADARAALRPAGPAGRRGAARLRRGARARRRAGWWGTPAQVFGDKVEADFAAGLAAGVGGTPTVFIDGRLSPGRVEAGALRRAIGMAPGRTGQARTDGATQGRGGSVGGPSVSGEHSENRSPRTRSRTTPATAAVTEPARMPIVACSRSALVGERQVGDEQRDGEPDPGQRRPGHEVRPADAAGQHARARCAARRRCPR